MRISKPLKIAICAAALILLSGAEPREELLWRHRNLGKAFYENPTTQTQAVEEFRKALEIAPNSARERLNYGLALLRAGKTKEGVTELQKVQKQDPKLPHTWFNLGMVFKKEGNFEQALPQFQQSVELTPDEPVSHYNLGVLYKQAGRLDEAAKQFETAVRLNPLLAAPHFQLYNLYRTQSKPDDATRELKAFSALKKQQEGAAIPEDMEWSDYAEIYDPIDGPAQTDAKALEPIYKDEKLQGIADPETAGMLALDADGDGRADLLVWSSKGMLLYRAGRELVADSGLGDLKEIISVAAGDFNNDGLADLCVLTSAGPVIYNNGKGKFVRVAAALPADRFEKAIWIDYDHDYDLDLMLLGEKSVLLRNQGAAGFSDRTKNFPFVEGRAFDATLFRLMADSKAFDLVVSYKGRAGVLYRDKLAGQYEAVTLDALPAGSKSLVAEDINNDSWLDLVSSAGVIENKHGKLENRAATVRERLAQADFNNDGLMDRARVNDDGSVHLLLNRSTAKNNWLRVQLTGVKNLKLATAAEVEVKAGTRYRKKLYDGLPVLFDLGTSKEADTVRITWPNGLIQNEPKQAANRAYLYKEAQRLSGSCPMIWTWNGKQFQFITDVLGVAPLGASSGDGKYFPVAHQEYIQIPGEALTPVNGRYEVRITEELSEVAFLDQIRLFALDHAANVDIYTNEKFKGPPFPEFRLYGASKRVYPRSARDDAGGDVLPRLLSKDRTYPDTFHRSTSGVAELHSLELDFGTNAARENKAVLIMSGWVDWADGSTYLAASQEGKEGLIPPYLQVRDAKGNWQTVIEDMGMPAGKPKTIAVDLTGKFLSASRAVRVVTNLCVYWDEIFLSEESSAPATQMTALPGALADIRFRGFSPSRIHPERKQPETFFYAGATAVSLWNPTPGMYTRYGDVQELVDRADDRFVIMESGDELQLRFDAARLPGLKSGWTRDFLLLVDGWAKDRDANTAFSQTVEPLPFHAMSQYPYPAPEHYPDDAEHRAYRQKYNTRPALRLIRPLVSKNNSTSR